MQETCGCAMCWRWGLNEGAWGVCSGKAELLRRSNELWWIEGGVCRVRISCSYELWMIEPDINVMVSLSSTISEYSVWWFVLQSCMPSHPFP